MTTVAKRSTAQPTLFGDAPNQPTPLVVRRGRTAEDGGLTISSRTWDLLDAATEIEQQDAREVGAVGYAARLWAQLSLPYKDPRDAGLWIRRNGSLTLRVMPGLVGAKGSEATGYPYGVLPRYILTWMSTEAVRTRSPELQLGNSLNDFMGRLGLTATGGRNGTITRLNDQMRRLLTSSMYVEDNREGDSRWGIAGAHFSVATGFKLWYDDKDRTAEKPLWGSTITLGDAFYESIVAAPVPVGTRALAALAGSPMKIDMLVWLSHRLGYLRLRAYVVIELKAGKFEAGYLGQLGMYMAAVDDLLAHPQDNPTIGLLLCKSKSDVVAEYALPGYNAPIGVAEWATALAADLPEELSDSLPSIADLEAELAAAVETESSGEDEDAAG